MKQSTRAARERAPDLIRERAEQRILTEEYAEQRRRETGTRSRLTYGLGLGTQPLRAWHGAQGDVGTDSSPPGGQHDVARSQVIARDVVPIGSSAPAAAGSSPRPVMPLVA